MTERMFKSGLIKLMTIVLCVLPGKNMTYLFTIIFSIILCIVEHSDLLPKNVFSCILDHLGGRIK